GGGEAGPGGEGGAILWGGPPAARERWMGGVSEKTPCTRCSVVGVAPRAVGRLRGIASEAARRRSTGVGGRVRHGAGRCRRLPDRQRLLAGRQSPGVRRARTRRSRAERRHQR